MQSTLTEKQSLIDIDTINRTFHLHNGKVSYVLGVEENEVLTQLYFGHSIRNYHGLRQYPRIDRSFSPNAAGANDRLYSLDTLPQEFPSYGHGDFREPAVTIKQANGSRITSFRYVSYEVFNGKPKRKGLPATYVHDDKSAETLAVTLEDQVTHLKLKLSYTIFRDYGAITRHAELINDSKQEVTIERLMSLNIDFPKNNYNLLQLGGRYAAERSISIEPISNGIKTLDSKRGSSSHMQNPFFALTEPGISESKGEVYGFNLVYSGNHKTLLQQDPYEQLRIQMGINDFQFEWKLAPSERFQTPEAVMVYSAHGLGLMSQTYHKLYQNHLIRGNFQHKVRPVLMNNWEATYFDFDEQKINAIAESGKKLGVELFVLDDGWFGRRNADTTSLGDWYVNETKLPKGLSALSKAIHSKGMKFGLWFEPEMISRNSDLFKKHPDWALQVPNRGISLGRDQYVLDFSRGEVRERIYVQIKAILDHCGVDYIKWDMNRNMTEVYSSKLPPDQQGETAHRYMLGLYEFLDKLTTEYPNILFESCSGGGGRFDAGMLYYMPQTWTSDNTDAVSRLKIQYGTSLVYPISTIGAHVSAVPNHQTGRITDMEIRGNVALSGNLGYELNLGELSEQEQQAVQKQIEFYKAHRELIQFGDFYRLLNPFTGDQAAWQFVSPDKKHSLVMFFTIMNEASLPMNILKLAGLDADTEYLINGNKKADGDELMHVGFYTDPQPAKDFTTQLFELKAVNSQD